MIETIGTILGLMGMMCFLTAFFMLQKKKWGSHSYPYLSANLIGAILLLISLMIDWNLPAFLLEAAWGLISMWGLITLTKSRRK